MISVIFISSVFHSHFLVLFLVEYFLLRGDKKWIDWNYHSFVCMLKLHCYFSSSESEIASLRNTLLCRHV